ncbi:MAG: ABC transporter ATP-binding protein [Deltaproteobacteria bacterium]|nr:ABC transporter ATP-binding protein [Deltaproteobacteria bacterium]
MAILTIQNLFRHFGGVAAINGVNLAFSENELRSIIGPNGAGKTTLFNVITGKLSANSGQIVFRGQDITNRPPHEVVRLGICRTFQKSSIFPGLTVLENVRIARQIRVGGSRRIFAARDSLKTVQEETQAILERLGLRDKGKMLASSLSHGDQRLMEIGVALAGAPRLLLLDEPTAGMSPRETEQTMHLIRQLAKDVAVILVEHDMEVVMTISDKISVMHQGAIIAEGNPDEIQKNDQVREAYLGKED